ncbi:hypothetical protein [Embleya sp. NPDC005971]|uniref:hypothetical protein n=1 Tax=Embleya sp. NPDC005971 TaxID=3156724 RepID=UPI0033E7B486
MAGVFGRRRTVALAVVGCSVVVGGIVLATNEQLPWQSEEYAAPSKVCSGALAGKEAVRFVSGSAKGSHGDIRTMETVRPVSQTFSGSFTCEVSVPVARGAASLPASRFIETPVADRARLDFTMSGPTSETDGKIWSTYQDGATPLGSGLSGAVTDNEAWVLMPKCEKTPSDLRDIPRFARLGVARTKNASTADTRAELAAMLTRLANRAMEAVGCTERIPALDISAGPVRRTALPATGGCLPVGAAELGIGNVAGWSQESFVTNPDSLSWCDLYNERGERALRFTKMRYYFADPRNSVNYAFPGGRALQWGCEPGRGSRAEVDAAPVRVLDRSDDRLRPLGELKAALVSAAPEPAACAVAAK